MHASDQAGMPKIGEQDLEERFTYLGSIMRWDGDGETDVKSRSGKDSAIFQQMQICHLLPFRSTSNASIMIPMAIYASEM